MLLYLSSCVSLLLGLNRLLSSRGVGKLHTLLDVALKDRYELINSLLLNSIELTKATHILNSFRTKLDLQTAAQSQLLVFGLCSSPRLNLHTAKHQAVQRF